MFVNVCEPNKAICALLLHWVTYQGHFAQVKVAYALNLSQERCFDNEAAQGQAAPGSVWGWSSSGGAGVGADPC